MNKEQLIGRLLAATSEELRKVEAVFTGKDESTNTGERRLMTLMGALQESNAIQTTVLLSADKKSSVWQFVFRFQSGMAMRHTVMVACIFSVWRLILEILAGSLR